MSEQCTGVILNNSFNPMETTLVKSLLFLLFASFLVGLKCEEGSGAVQRENNATSQSHHDVVVNNKKKNDGGGGGAGGGGGVGWGWGGGGGGGNQRGGWGWGNGGGGGVYWRWGCNGRRPNKKRVFPKDEYVIGEFAQCMVKGRCRGMRLDCPLHCGGPCFYDCTHMCKPHCRH